MEVMVTSILALLFVVPLLKGMKAGTSSTSIMWSVKACVQRCVGAKVFKTVKTFVEYNPIMTAGIIVCLVPPIMYGWQKYRKYCARLREAAARKANVFMMRLEYAKYQFVYDIQNIDGDFNKRREMMWKASREEFGVSAVG